MASEKNHIDRITLFVVLILMVSSTVVVYSASSTWAMQKMQDSSGLVNKHIAKILAGLVVMFLAINMDYKKYKPLTKWVLIGSVVLLFAVRVLGGEVKGAIITAAGGADAVAKRNILEAVTALFNIPVQNVKVYEKIEEGNK